MPSGAQDPDEDAELAELAAAKRRRGLRVLLTGLSWRSTVIIAALGIALAAWLPILAVCCLGWISAPRIGFGSVLTTSARLWLLAHGVPARLGGGLISLVPLGSTALIILLIWRLSRRIARRAADELIEGPVRSRQQSELRSLSCRLALWFAIPYTLVLAAVTIMAGQSDEFGRALLCGALIGGCSLVASGRALGWAPVSLSQGGWSTGVLAGAGAALTGLVLLGCIRLAVVLIAGHSTFTAVHESLGAGGLGTVLLALVQALWIPSMVLWACSWVLGAGFTLGQGSLVAPLGSTAGKLPAVPLLAAMSTGDSHPVAIAGWLLAAALAGALGAHICVRARHDDARRSLPERHPGLDEDAGYGLLVGVLAGLLLCLLALASSGALGTQRLAGLGPDLGRLLVLAPTVLGAGGVLGGFLTALRLSRGQNG